MKLEGLKLICVKKENTWCVFFENKLLNGLVVEVDDLKDAPKELAKAFKILLEIGFKENIHKIEE